MKLHRLLFFLLFSFVSILNAQTVWPGDVNNNGVVNEADLLFLAFGFGETGPQRKVISAAWEAQDVAESWPTSLTGINLAFADCNGDGLVDDQDIDAIRQNFGLTHADVVFQPDAIPAGIPDASPSFSVLSEDLTIRPNTRVIQVDIGLGDTQIPVDNLMGISFFIKANRDAFDTENLDFDFNNEEGWLSRENAAIIKRTIPGGRSAPGDFVVAYAKTDRRPSGGDGLIGTLTVSPSFIIEGNVPDFRISIDSIILLDELQNKVPVLGTEIVFQVDRFVDSTALATTICQGDTLAFGDTLLTESGLYRDTVMNSFGGDSILILNLAVEAVSQTFTEATLCAGESLLFNNVNLSVAGTYFDTSTTANGCENVTVLDLTILDTVQTVLNEEICPQDQFVFNNQLLTTSGIYRDTLQTVNGCDSFVVVNLSVLENVETPLERTICAGESIIFNEQTISQTGRYFDTIPGFNGCDRFIMLDLEVLDTLQTVVNRTICDGESIAFNGEARTTSGTYRDTLQAANGCDQFVILNLTVLGTSAAVVNEQICAGETYLFNNQALTSTGRYEAAFQSSNGCDSLVVLDLEVTEMLQTTINQTICEGSSYLFEGQELASPGTFQATLTSFKGCDSLITLNLQVSDRFETELNEQICEGDQFDFNNQSLTTSGVYEETFVATNGCDSLVRLNLVVGTPVSSQIQQEICRGDSYVFNNQFLTEEGVYLDTLNTVNGCDSFVQLTLMLTDNFESISDAVLCPGDTISFFGFVLTTPNTYIVNLPSARGCDSMIILNVTMANDLAVNIDTAICAGESLVFDGEVISEAGSYTGTFQNILGCDSIVTLNLVIEADCQSVSTEEQLVESIKIYPNPVEQDLFISSPSVPIEGWQILNLTGQVIQQQFYPNTTIQQEQRIDLQTIIPGVYLLLIHTEYGIKQAKIAKL